MGCGASKVAPQNGVEPKLKTNDGKTVEPEPRSNGHTNRSVHRPKSSDRKDSDNKPSTAELNGNVPANPQESRDVCSEQTAEETRHSPSKPSNGVISHASPQLPPLSKAVAFDIDLGKNGSVSPAGRPPRRLQKIESAPVLTREVLQQKQAAAEQNRQKELDKKVKVMSKRRSELLLAREMDKAQQQKVELEVKLSASEKKREKAQAEIKDKQRRREEKAKRVRMRARQMKDGDDVMDLNVDPDETYNADEEDESWDIVSPQSFSRSMGEEDENNNQRFDDREDTAPQMKDSETKPEQQDQNINEVHDFFDT